MSSAQAGVLLEAKGIAKSFPGVRALDGVELSIRGGTVTALVGENGAGKSTLMNILSGVFPPDEGEISIGGEVVALGHTREAAKRGIAIIHQELNLIEDMSIAENIFLGREPRNSWGLIDFRRMNRAAKELMDRLRLKRDPAMPIRALRVGEQQLIEIAKALSLEARIIFMDEPTSALSGGEVALLFDVITSLKQEGAGIVYVTHKMDEVFRICDSVVVLRDGAFIGAKPLNETSRDEIVRMMVGRNLEAIKRAAPPDTAKTVFRVDGLCSKGGRDTATSFLKDISLQLRAGEVVGLFGLMGAGRTELLETLFGAHPITAGSVFVGTKPVRAKSPRDAVDAGIGLAPEDRKSDGLVLSMDVAANISLAATDQITRLGVLRSGLESKLAAQCVQRLRIKTPSLSPLVSTLSGGNQQKVVLAKWLTRKPRVLLLDEPTRGIDVNAKREIYGVMRSLAAEGIGILFASSELPEVLMLADRILVMSEGRITGEFRAEAATEEALLDAALPMAPARL